MNYQQLKDEIAEVIRTNGNEEITGEVLQYILIEMVSTLGKDYQFMGVGTPETEVGTPDDNQAWILGAGEYRNFGSPFVVAENQFAVAEYNGQFTVRLVTVGRPVDPAITPDSPNPVEGGAIAEEFAKLRGAGYLYAGMVTPESEAPAELSEKIFYLCTQGGTYTNFDGVQVERGVNVLFFNGSQWGVDHVLGITDNAEDGSVSLITSTGVYHVAELKVDKEEGKGLSEANFTNQEKAKLTALPTAQELADILALKQDNLTFDNTPTDGSANPVTSDGIFEAIKNFITKAVDDLINYYTKSQTYTKDEVQALIAAIKQFNILAVNELPVASAQTVDTLYLVPSENPGTQNVKDEYITLTKQEGGQTVYYWECIGRTEIDLSNYTTFSDVNTAIATALAAYYTSTQVDNLIAAAVGSVADISIEVDKDVVLTDTTATITVTGRSQVSATSLVLTRGGSPVATGSGKLVIGYDTVNVATAGVLTYLLTAIIGGVERTQEVTVDVKDAVLFGAGTQATDITTKASARKAPAGRYSITAADSDYLFFLVPSGMTINSIKMGGLEVPFEAPTGITVGGKSYICYQSSNIYDAGTYTIDVV